MGPWGEVEGGGGGRGGGSVRALRHTVSGQLQLWRQRPLSAVSMVFPAVVRKPNLAAELSCTVFNEARAVGVKAGVLESADRLQRPEREKKNNGVRLLRSICPSVGEWKLFVVTKLQNSWTAFLMASDLRSSIHQPFTKVNIFNTLQTSDLSLILCMLKYDQFSSDRLINLSMQLFLP